MILNIFVMFLVQFLVFDFSSIVYYAVRYVKPFFGRLYWDNYEEIIYFW